MCTHDCARLQARRLFGYALAKVRALREHLQAQGPPDKLWPTPGPPPPQQQQQQKQQQQQQQRMDADTACSVLNDVWVTVFGRLLRLTASAAEQAVAAAGGAAGAAAQGGSQPPALPQPSRGGRRHELQQQQQPGDAEDGAGSEGSPSECSLMFPLHKAAAAPGSPSAPITLFPPTPHRAAHATTVLPAFAPSPPAPASPRHCPGAALQQATPAFSPEGPAPALHPRWAQPSFHSEQVQQQGGNARPTPAVLQHLHGQEQRRQQQDWSAQQQQHHHHHHQQQQQGQKERTGEEQEDLGLHRDQDRHARRVHQHKEPQPQPQPQRTQRHGQEQAKLLDQRQRCKPASQAQHHSPCPLKDSLLAQVRCACACTTCWLQLSAVRMLLATAVRGAHAGGCSCPRCAFCLLAAAVCDVCAVGCSTKQSASGVVHVLLSRVAARLVRELWCRESGLGQHAGRESQARRTHSKKKREKLRRQSNSWC